MPRFQCSESRRVSFSNISLDKVQCESLRDLLYQRGQGGNPLMVALGYVRFSLSIPKLLLDIYYTRIPEDMLAMGNL
jgi:hypothetical protein